MEPLIAMFLANNLLAFKQRFIQQLHQMLDSDSLGAFILVLANSMQDEELYASLKKPIEQRFKELSVNTPDAPVDDQQVFEKIKESGIASLTCWEYLNKEAWELIYNPLRAMRPARASQEVVDQIRKPFDADKFHFNKHFLRPEILWEGSWEDRDNKENTKHFRVLFNKFPFSPWHILIVPEPEKEQPQYLTAQAHHDIFSLSMQSDHFHGFGIGYNSLGANASINQLHFQGFIRDMPLPIEDSKWQHNGGDQAYPLTCFRYQNSQGAWQKISKLHLLNQPYTLLYRNGCCYVIARKGQGKAKVPDWVKGAGWHEVCGALTFADKDTIVSLSSQDVFSALEKMNI